MNKLNGIGSLALLALMIGPVMPASAQMINHKGWNMPDPSKMTLFRVKKFTLPGMPFEIKKEVYLSEELDPANSEDPDKDSIRIMNPAKNAEGRPDMNKYIEQQIDYMGIYKDEQGHVLIYDILYDLSFREARSSVICDIDNDGCLESRYDNISVDDEQSFMASIIKIKLGLSDESESIRKKVHSTVLRSRAESRKKGKNK